MSVLVLIELSLKPKIVDDFMNFMKNELSHTRGFEGCNGLTVHKNQSNPNNVVLVEDSDTRQHHHKRMELCSERGDMEKLGSFFAGEPSIRYYDNAQV